MQTLALARSASSKRLSPPPLASGLLKSRCQTPPTVPIHYRLDNNFALIVQRRRISNYTPHKTYFAPPPPPPRRRWIRGLLIISASAFLGFAAGDYWCESVLLSLDHLPVLQIKLAHDAMEDIVREPEAKLPLDQWKYVHSIIRTGLAANVLHEDHEDCDVRLWSPAQRLEILEIIEEAEKDMERTLDSVRGSSSTYLLAWGGDVHRLESLQGVLA